MNTEQDEALAEILHDIQRAATRVGREWGAVTTVEDIEQEITLHLLDKRTVKRLAEFDPAARRETLYRIGTQLAVQERVDYDHFTGNFLYSTRDVREILGRGTLHEQRERTYTERLDLDEATALLRDKNPRYAELIWKRYVLEETVTEKMALSRAVDSLTDCMNQINAARRRGYDQGPGSRAVISNDQARQISRDDYAGNGSAKRALNPEYMEG
ncbi:hypothetical protein [Amycolatopsis sp.]|uniref:hypothetical protein n=1 Tax=Amycolatopsis sp. TaxID=37632 RepID=UPI002CE1531F|nr:hypothetical protein [Amycolatopsis sp.]HVV11613.1 hypothetical protein [Amycolatopsis sp.]